MLLRSHFRPFGDLCLPLKLVSNSKGSIEIGWNSKRMLERRSFAYLYERACNHSSSYQGRKYSESLHLKHNSLSIHSALWLLIWTEFLFLLFLLLLLLLLLFPLFGGNMRSSFVGLLALFSVGGLSLLKKISMGSPLCNLSFAIGCPKDRYE